jgi:hypothetical protein
MLHRFVALASACGGAQLEDRLPHAACDMRRLVAGCWWRAHHERPLECLDTTEREGFRFSAAVLDESVLRGV